MAEKPRFHYIIQYTKAADHFLSQQAGVRKQFEDAIRGLRIGDHPENVDVKRVLGKRNNYYRIKLGGYRVVYAIINGTIVVVKTLLAGPRGDVYKKMSGLK